MPSCLELKVTKWKVKVICRTIFFVCQVRAIGMASPDLLQLVENCPTGAETLIARILNIITDKGKI